jgi:myosin heavy subunit
LKRYNGEKVKKGFKKINKLPQRPIGVLSILDEECKFPKASDQTFLEKLHKNLEKTPRYEKPRLSKTDFGVEHFAGKVTYNSVGFLDKNKDTMQDDLKNVCLSSSVSLYFYYYYFFCANANRNFRNLW